MCGRFTTQLTLSSDSGVVRTSTGFSQLRGMSLSVSKGRRLFNVNCYKSGADLLSLGPIRAVTRSKSPGGSMTLVELRGHEAPSRLIGVKTVCSLSGTILSRRALGPLSRRLSVMNCPVKRAMAGRDFSKGRLRPAVRAAGVDHLPSSGRVRVRTAKVNKFDNSPIDSDGRHLIKILYDKFHNASIACYYGVGRLIRLCGGRHMER